MSNGTTTDNIIRFQAKEKETNVHCILFIGKEFKVTCSLIEKPNPDDVIYDHYYDDEVNDTPY